MKEVVGLHCGMFLCPNRWTDRLPPETLRPDREEAVGRFWDLLALTPEGCAHLTGCCPRCRVLLLPGNCRMMGMADTVITYGLSSRDSLTLSSLEEPVLCVQRSLPRPDGPAVEPQEVPLRDLPLPAEQLLPLLGLRLLQMPLT